MKLMAVFAHPDDEAFGMGGTLARYGAAGHEVYLVMATRGEAGLIADPAAATTANLPYVRELELRCACEIYGIQPPRFLDYLDGQLPIVNQGQAVGKLVRILRELRPDVVVTFGPEGIYGHYDHIAVHRWTSIAVKLAAERSCFPDPRSDVCESHQVKKFYYNVISKAQVDSMTDGDPLAGVMMDGVPFPFIGYRQEEITTVIDVGDYVETKLRGIRCHLTQVGPGGPYADMSEDVREEPRTDRESFILAHSTVGYPERLETDLFAGLS